MKKTATSPLDKPFILVDGSSYLFRAFHALPPLINSTGLPTGAIYGVLNMIKKLIKEYQPVYMAVIFDSKEKTFRKTLYPLYKANRETMPDELQVQIAPLHEVIKALGLPLIVIPGVEADDVIATLALQAEQQQLPVLISTGDKDLAQLVSPHITLINTMSNHKLNPDGVYEKFGVTPAQMVDYLALVGDSSDNIPGVPSVGPKTAAKWLAQYGSLANIQACAEEITGKVGEKLRAHLNDLPLAQTLVTVKKDVELPLTPEQLVIQSPDIHNLQQLFTQLEFKTWLAEYSNTASSNPAQDLASSTPSSPSVNQTYNILLDEASFNQWLNRLKQAESFALDTETTSLNPMTAQLVGLSFAINAHEAAYVPLTHDYLGAPQQLSKSWVLNQLQPLLNDPNKTIIGQNLKYDLEILQRNHLIITARLWDCLLASYVLKSIEPRHDLDSMALKYLNYTTVKFTDIAGTGSKQLTFNQIPLEQAGPYAAEDADITLQIHHVLAAKLKNQPRLQRLLTEIELPLLPILVKMELRGVLIDTAMLNAQSETLHHRIQKLEQEVYDLAGFTFNLSSPKQLQELLFDKLNLPMSKKTPTGQSSTAEKVLQELAINYPIPKLLLEHRSLIKLKSTYVDRLPQQINQATGRVHTSYNQAVTTTGRLSSKDPNLQNIPIRSEEGRKIRQAFIAPPGFQILTADYSQIELRIMAHLSQDPGLLRAFELGLDVHASTAAEIFSIPLEQVTFEHRRRAKAINFGLMYGMSSFGVAQQLGISRSDAKKHMDVYFQLYPKVQEFMAAARDIAKTQGFVETLYGRRIDIPDINTRNPQRRMAAERAAINAPLQGTAADIIKIAMLTVDRWLTTNQMDNQIYMIMQVHDELVFEVAESVLTQAKEGIKCCMEQNSSLSIPLVVNLGVGKHWDEAHS